MRFSSSASVSLTALFVTDAGTCSSDSFICAADAGVYSFDSLVCVANAGVYFSDSVYCTTVMCWKLSTHLFETLKTTPET